MALFIHVEVDKEVASQPDLVRKLVEVCPVDIFTQRTDKYLDIVEENLDECTLCGLCIQASPPGKIRITKLYEDISSPTRILESKPQP